MKTTTIILAFFLIGIHTLNAQSKLSSYQKPTLNTGQNANDNLLNWVQGYVKVVPPAPKLQKPSGILRNSVNYQYMVAQQAKADKNRAYRCAVTCIENGGNPYRCTNLCDCVYINGGNIFSCIRSGTNHPAAASAQKVKGN